MIPVHYVWLVWSGSFLVPWAALFILCPRYRLLMWWSSLLTLPFALSEPLFLGRYWSPPSLFNLARRAHFDLESFIFCFGIGGVAAVVYHVVTRRPLIAQPRTPKDPKVQVWQGLCFAAPAPVFFAVLILLGLPMWAGIGGFLAGAMARVLCYPALAAKTCLGGLMFLGYYLCFLLLLDWMAPGYRAHVWNPDGTAALHILGFPLTEELFGLSFGLYWSGLLEQMTWTFAPLAPR